MMASVEQLEAQPTGLASLSKTLDIFDTYKSNHDDEKDSDEESFHLPMLGCDDDLESNINKEGAICETEKNKPILNGESEDDILNRFETVGTPEIDPKIEDSILDDIDDICDKKDSKICGNQGKEETGLEDESHNKVEESSEDKVALSNRERNEPMSDTSKESEKSNELPNGFTVADKDLEHSKGQDDLRQNIIIGEEKDTTAIEKQNKNISEVSININDKENSQEKSNKDDRIEKTLDKEANVDKIGNNEETNNVESVEKDGNEKTILVDELNKGNKESEETENESNDIIESPSGIVKTSTDTAFKTSIMVGDSDVNNENLNNKKFQAQQEKLNADEKMNIEETIAEKECMDTKCIVTKNDTEKIELSENMEVDPDSYLINIEDKNTFDNKEDRNTDSTVRKSDDLVALNIVNEGCSDYNKQEVEKESDKCIETELNQDVVSIGNDINKKNYQEGEVCKEPSNGEQENSIPIEASKEKREPDKGENSNDSSKSHNLECDDLLDISVIRDVDEDNASAIAETIAENANEAHLSEKSDNDEQDEGSDKAENDLDDSEMDQEESLLANDKDDNMDFEDGNSDQDNIISSNASDSESKDDIKDVEPKCTDSVLKDINKSSDSELNKKLTDSEKTQTDEEMIETEKDPAEIQVSASEDSLNENAVKLGKRSLSDAAIDEEVSNKKIKLTVSAKEKEKKTVAKNDKAKTLLTFQKYMQNKKMDDNLSRSDLEQFCLQKICEAIMHKTDVGELHQTIKKQEAVIENLRKDLQQLTKQTRDLDIVNKKLMNELKFQNGNKKPLVPLKITRSVGLQVKLNLNAEPCIRRKQTIAPVPRIPTPSNKLPLTRTISAANANVVRQVASSPSPRKTQTSTPLLSQALQNRQVATGTTRQKQTPIRPKPSENQKAGNPGVIDLTDEDDKAAKTVVGTPIKIINKIPAAKTVNVIPGKAVPNKTVNGNQTKSPAVKNTVAGPVGQVKNTTVGTKIGNATRTVTTLPQGVRLTSTVKNGSITIPASVVTSSAGTTQLMYVVQPTSSLGQVVTSTPGGTQKAVLLNFQPTNGVLTSTLNGSAVSVIPSKTANTVQLKAVATTRKHPAPLPTPQPIPVNPALKPLLPKPHLSIRKTDTGIILQWRMPYNLDVYESIASYQLFAYQETNAIPSTDMWRKVGDVKALALPMACTLTQFADKNKYYFAVRSVDVHKRIGAFSDPEEISL